MTLSISFSEKLKKVNKPIELNGPCGSKCLTFAFFLSIGLGFRFSGFWNNQLPKGCFQNSSGLKLVMFKY
jgi:hypothetical protein